MPGHNAAILFEANQHRPGAGAPDEIARAIDGVYDPAPAIFRFPHGAFFAQQTVIGESGGETFHNELFTRFVGNGNGGFVGLDLDSQ